MTLSKADADWWKETRNALRARLGREAFGAQGFANLKQLGPRELLVSSSHVMTELVERYGALLREYEVSRLWLEDGTEKSL